MGLLGFAAAPVVCVYQLYTESQAGKVRVRVGVRVRVRVKVRVKVRVEVRVRVKVRARVREQPRPRRHALEEGGVVLVRIARRRYGAAEARVARGVDHVGHALREDLVKVRVRVRVRIRFRVRVRIRARLGLELGLLGLLTSLAPCSRFQQTPRCITLL